MSKIGKKQIAIPSGVTLQVTGGLITVTGPMGTIAREFPSTISIVVDSGMATVASVASHRDRKDRAQWGLWRALIRNMIQGVSEGWRKTLEFQGVGYKAAVKGANLELVLGYSHPITVLAPDGVTFTTDKTSITVAGIDREAVGQIAAVIRSQRLPEPYKGSGIRYSDEIIKRKVGKRAATAA